MAPLPTDPTMSGMTKGSRFVPDARTHLGESAASLAAALGGRDGACRKDETARRLVDELDLIEARSRHPDVPLLVVLAGSTGVGTSTLLNSVVGRRVSPTGVRRPTTTTPVLVHRPRDDPAQLVTLVGAPVDVVADETVPEGIAVLDSPGMDSVGQPARSRSAMLIAAADAWVAVTSPARYADAAGWSHLAGDAARHVPTAIVLNRTVEHARADVTEHLASLLSRHGLAECPFLVVDDNPGAEGMLPPAAVDRLRSLLSTLGQDPSLRALARRSSLAAAVDVAVRRAQAWVSSQPEEDARRDDVRRAVEGLRAIAARELS